MLKEGQWLRVLCKIDVEDGEYEVLHGQWRFPHFVAPFKTHMIVISFRATVLGRYL
jgi:hypothetical protein